MYAAEAAKHRLRAALRARRRVLDLDLKSTSNFKIINHLRTLVMARGPAQVALYYPQLHEPDVRPLVGELWQAGFAVLLPRVVARDHALVFNEWRPYAPLETDALGLPCAGGIETHPAYMVIPMLGYTRQGHRLGQGGGFYDRTLAALRYPTLTIGVCHTSLEVAVAEFPHQPHDRRLDMIVTGKEVIAC